MTFRLSILGAAVGATACTVLLAGCSGGYYMVREPGSATPYYTTDIEKAGSAVQFKDAKTGSAITLQNSEVKEISKDEYTKGMATPAPSPAVGAVTPVPAAGTATAPAVVVAPVPAATAAPAAAGASAPAPEGKPQ